VPRLLRAASARAVPFPRRGLHVMMFADIAWKIDEEAQRLELTWSEKGGPSVSALSRQSFGTRLVALGHQLKGEVRLAYEPTGFVSTLDVPMTSLVAPA
jgi:two-component sensor histidine kinase